MVYRLISKLYPKKIKEKYVDVLKYANVSIDPNRLLGFLLFFGFGLAWLIAFNLSSFFNLNLFLVFVISFIVFEVVVYLYLLLKVEARATIIEKSLPDALQLMSSNLRAGLTVERSLLLSARPEFGPLKDEIDILGREITLGEDVTDALNNMSKRVRSDKLDKTIRLLVSGLRSGGQLAPLLEQTSNNLRNREFLEQKVRSSVMLYVIFIFVAVGIGAPLLYGLSSFLIDVLTNILTRVEIPERALANLPLKFSGISIEKGFVLTYAITSLITTSVFGGLMIGLISKGEERRGVKYIPILIIITISIFFIARYVMSAVLGGLFAF